MSYRLMAIGDGRNDRAMLFAAHVGVGIRGSPATTAADITLDTFSGLRRLLFSLGRRHDRGASRIVLLSFYKALACTFPAWLFGFASHFSAGQFYLESFGQLFNFVFTSLPLLALAVLDSDTASHVADPGLYRDNRERGITLCVARWIMKAVADVSSFFFSSFHVSQASVSFFVVTCTFSGSSLPFPTGQTTDLWQFTSLVFACVLASITLRVLVESATAFGVVAFLSLLSWLLFLLAGIAVPFTAPTTWVLLTSPQAAVAVFTSAVLCLAPSVTWRTVGSRQFTNV